MNKSHVKRESSFLSPDQTVVVDGVQINYRARLLDQGAPSLLLIHGFGASLTTWADIFEELSPNYSVLCLDLKGAGHSGKPSDGKYSPADQAALVNGFIRELKLTNVVLAGHSLGGGIALLAYLQARERQQDHLRALILIDSAGYPQKLPFFVKVVRNPITRWLSYVVPPQQRARFVLNRIITLKDQITDERVNRYAFWLDAPGSHRALRETARTIVPGNVSEISSQLASIDLPTLILWGEDDPVIRVDKAHRFRSEIAKSRLVILARTGHIPHEERPAESVAAMNEFLNSIP